MNRPSSSLTSTAIALRRNLESWTARRTKQKIEKLDEIIGDEQRSKLSKRYLLDVPVKPGKKR
jgi:hypothetical protein